MNTAGHQRNYRQRHKRGEIVLPVVVHEHDLADALTLSGRLGEPEALDRGKLSEATADVLREWVARWLAKYR